MLTQKLNEGYAKAYVRLIHATFEGMLNAAVDDGIILANPAAKMGRKMRLVQTRAAKQEEIKAFTREQRDHFLAVTLAHKPKLYALFLLMTRTGLRPGEAVALTWADVNLHPEERSIRVERTLSARKIGTPKSGHGRSVDVSAELRVTLLKLQVERKEETLRKSWGTVPEWVFCSRVGRIVDYSWVAKDFGRLLRYAGLPSHFTPHCLRHTYASLLLQTGISPVYVQRQLGHASIQMTCDLYGKWLPIGEKSWVDGLDSSATQRNGSKMVANGDFRGRGPRTMEARHVVGSPEAIDFPMVSQDDQVRSPTSTASLPAPAAPRRSSSAGESQRTASRWRSPTSRPTSRT